MAIPRQQGSIYYGQTYTDKDIIGISSMKNDSQISLKILTRTDKVNALHDHCPRAAEKFVPVANGIALGMD